MLYGSKKSESLLSRVLASSFASQTASGLDHGAESQRKGEPESQPARIDDSAHSSHEDSQHLRLAVRLQGPRFYEDFFVQGWRRRLHARCLGESTGRADDCERRCVRVRRVCLFCGACAYPFNLNVVKRLTHKRFHHQTLLQMGVHDAGHHRDVGTRCPGHCFWLQTSASDGSTLPQRHP